MDIHYSRAAEAAGELPQSVSVGDVTFGTTTTKTFTVSKDGKYDRRWMRTGDAKTFSAVFALDILFDAIADGKVSHVEEYIGRQKGFDEQIVCARLILITKEIVDYCKMLRTDKERRALPPHPMGLAGDW